MRMHIEVPVEEVFGFFRDPGNWRSLEPEGVEFKEIRLTPEGLGTHYCWAAKVAGFSLEGFGVFSEFIPNQRITDRSSSSLEGTWTYQFEPDGSGTKLTVENRVGSCWRIPPLEKLLDWVAARTHEPRFARAKEILEARASGAGRRAGPQRPAAPGLVPVRRLASKAFTSRSAEARPRHRTGEAGVNGIARTFKAWQYRGGRPQLWARIENRLWAFVFAVGLWNRAATLEVRGRKSGRLISFPVAIAHDQGEHYLVAMLGERTNWVRNVRAAGGRAVLRQGRRRPVQLAEVPVGQRAPILRDYLGIAPGARPHFPVRRGAPLEDFGRIAARYPVFRIAYLAVPASRA